ncbi:unnamed protein product [Tenebrio molitor]|nr:unnamed protein product [Tenebrio molitor]
MSVRVRSSLTNKRLRSGKSGAAPGTDHPVGGRTAETIIQSCQGLRRTELNKKGENTRWRLRDSKFVDSWGESRKDLVLTRLSPPPLSAVGVRYGQWSKFGVSIRRWHVTTRVENNRMILSETED